MESKPSVTIVVPIYNVEKYLRRCVESLLAQDYSSLEIILVDDGSPDNSGTICDEYASIYNNIKVIHKENGGLSSARKAGFDMASGMLIAFVDSDDYVAPQYVSRLAEPFADENVQLSICGYATQSNSSIVSSKLPYNNPTIVNIDIATLYILPLIGTIQQKDAINIPGFVWIRMYRKNLLRASDFVSEREYFTEDILMNILYARRMSGNIAVINELLYYYCINPGSLTLKYRKNAFKMLLACNMQCELLTSSLPVDEMQRQSRIDANLVATVTYSIYNIGRIRNYRAFKCELLNILNTPVVKSLFDKGTWPMKATWHKIIFYAYKFKCYFILYNLLKTRKVL